MCENNEFYDLFRAIVTDAGIDNDGMVEGLVNVFVEGVALPIPLVILHTNLCVNVQTTAKMAA